MPQSIALWTMLKFCQMNNLNVTAFAALMQTLLQLKLQQPANDTFVITDKHVSAYQSVMQSSRHLATIGLRDQRCKLWHDPPVMLKDGQPLSRIFKAAISGASCNILLDTGAAADCISESFCKTAKLAVSPWPDQSSDTLADGQTCAVKGIVTAHVQLQTYKAKIRFLVIPLANCDAILGEPWHTSVRAVTVYGPQGLDHVRLYKGRSMRKITQPQPHVKLPSDKLRKPPDKRTVNLLSHLQFTKARRTCGAFIAVVKPAAELGVETKQKPSLAQDNQTLVDPENLDKLLKNYSTIFQPLPKGLPPFREATGHTIPLQSGAAPPYRSPYRMSPLELREVKKQIEELLEQGFIHPRKEGRKFTHPWQPTRLHSAKQIPVWIACTVCPEKGWLTADVHRLPCGE